MFGRRNKPTVSTYDKAGKVPVLRSSICTGEKVAGFKDPISGKFDDLMLIRNRKDMDTFLTQYQVTEEELQREW
jgi:hypothetical protein